MDNASEKIKAFILEEFLPGEDPVSLTDSTPLITGGILDSVATLKLVAFLEKEFGFQVEAHEVNAENMNTIAEITAFVRSRS